MRTKNNQLSRKAIKRAFGPQSTKDIIKAVEQVIQDKQLKKDMVAFIKAADGKKIKNTSGV